MAIRMQQRRGTEEQWTLANPVLAAGEFGWASDVNKFKVGDGVNSWDDLSYFISVDDLEVNIDDFVPLNTVGVADGVASLDNTGNVPLTQLGNVPATDISGKQDKVTGVSDTEIGYLDGVTSAIQTQLNGKASSSHTHAQSDITNLTTDLAAKLNLSGGTMTGNITLAGAPTQALHAATKAYVDAISEGLHIHASVVAATVTNVNISTDLEAGDVIDGVTLAEGDRILVKSQTNPAQNGIYVVQASGAPLRAADFNEPQEVDGGDFVFVTGGTFYDNTGWVQTTTNVVTIGTDPITFTQFSGAGTYQAGTGLTLTGNVFAADTTVVAPLAGPTFTGTVTLPNTTSIGDVSATELGYVNGVTSAIQTQIDGKASSSHTHAQSDITNLTTDLAAKAPLEGPTFTGTVTLPSNTSIGSVSSTELGHLDGVTSAIQTQLNAKTDITQPILARTSGYTLTAAEKSDLITCNGTFTIQIPGNIFVAGDRVDFINIGTGTITFSGSSLTLNAADAKFTVNKQWAGATVFFTSATTAVLIGNLA